MSRYKPLISTRFALIIIIFISIYFITILMPASPSSPLQQSAEYQDVLGEDRYEDRDEYESRSSGNTRGDRNSGGIKRFEPFLGADRGFDEVEMLNEVRDMMKHAWNGYIKYANGTDELQPLSKNGHNWYQPYSLLNTPVDSLDTLFIMGLEDEYLLAKDMVLNMTFNLPITINLFETIIRVVGGLLSAYELDGDLRLIDKAVELVDTVLPAFNGTLGIPLNQVSLQNPRSIDASSGCIAEIGTMQLEFQYLSDVTGNSKYAEVALRIYEEMNRASQSAPAKGLYAINFGTMGQLSLTGDKYGLGAASDSFYEYLLKMWISTGEEKYRVWYDESAESFSTLFVREHNGQTWVPNTYYTATINRSEEEMEHLACFSGGMFALGALTHRRGNWTRQLDVGEKITKTCYQAYNTTKSGLGPERFNGNTLTLTVAWYILRPEVIESIFYMWRFTHDPIYREYGRNIIQAFQTYSKNEAGYSGLRDVNAYAQDNLQQSFFLAETLKYLYLLFTSDDIIALEDYVFNTECHPVSIRGRGRRRDASRWSPIPFKSSKYGGLEPRGPLSEHSSAELAREEAKVEGEVTRKWRDSKLRRKKGQKNLIA